MNESRLPRLSACLSVILLLSLALLFPSCSSEDGDEGVVLSFKLDSTKLGRTDSLRFEIYNGHVPGPGDTTPPVQVVMVKTPKGGTVEVTLSDKVQSDFSMVVIGFNSTGAVQRKVYEFDDFQPDKDSPPVTALASITSGDLDMQPEETRVPSVTLLPAEAADKRVVMASLDTTVVRIVAGDRDSVKALKEGSAVVVITAVVGGAQGRFTVSVKAANRVKAIDSKALSGLVGDTLDPELTFDPVDARDKTFSLRSLDTDVAVIAGLRVFGKAEGKTEVEVTALDGGVKDTFEVTVSKVAIRVKGVQGKGIRGLVGDTVAPDLEWDPADATDKGFTLRSLDTAVARVAGRELAARKLGTARIEVTAADGGSKDTFNLAVVRAGFELDVLPITTFKCTPCHIPGQLFNFQDSLVLLRKGASALDRLQRDPDAAGKMPLKGAPNGDLTTRQLGVMLDWLRQYVVPVVNMTAKDMVLSLGDTAAPDLVWTPDSASNRLFSLTSIDSSVVAVTADNRLLPLQLGQTTVLAQSEEGAIKAQFKVTVSPPSFTRNVLPITTLKCAPCHVPGQTFNFQDSLVLIFEGANAMDRLQRDSLAAGKMPLRGAPAGDLTPGQKEIILAWLKTKVIPLKGITVANDSLLVGERKSPVVTYDPPNANNKSYALETDDTAFVEIDGTEYVGKSVGIASVKVKALDGGHVKTFQVKVKPVPVDSVVGVDTSGAIGDTVVPRTLIFPANAAVKTYALSLARPSAIIQVVPAKLAVVGLSLGKDTVVITSTDGAKLGRLVFTVGPVVPKGLTGVDTNVVLLQSAVPRMIWNPTNTTNKAFTLSIAPADTGIAALRAGNTILGKALGSVTVTTRSVADTSLKDGFKFTVGPVPVVSISARAHPSMVHSTTVAARSFLIFNPLNATNQAFTLVSSAPTRLLVANDTTVTAQRLGLTPVTVTSTDGSKTATWNVTVIRAPFTGAVKNTITLKCGACHYLGGPYPNWQDSTTAVNSSARIIARITATTSPMPPVGNPVLTTTPNGGEMKILQDYFNVQ